MGEIGELTLDKLSLVTLRGPLNPSTVGYRYRLNVGSQGVPPPYERGTPAASVGGHGWINSRLSLHNPHTLPIFFCFFTLVTGPRRSLSLKLSDTKVYAPIRWILQCIRVWQACTGVPRS